MKTILAPAALLWAVGLGGWLSTAAAGMISVNLNNTTSAAWVVSAAAVAGPLSGTNWNNTSTASGSGQALVDSDGNATSATLDWSSSNLWTNGDNNGSADRIILHPYLDDGGSGVLVTVNNVPYSQYNVHLIVSSGQNGNNSTYTTLDFNVNGSWVLGEEINGNGAAAATATAFGDWDAAEGAWAPITGDGLGAQTATGNYISFQTAGATLTIDGLNRSGNSRGSLAGLIIEEVPEPSAAVLLCLMAPALAARPRR
jgi:hypothetical protein